MRSAVDERATGYDAVHPVPSNSSALKICTLAN
jgi:hypothetical protein